LALCKEVLAPVDADEAVLERHLPLVLDALHFFVQGDDEVPPWVGTVDVVLVVLVLVVVEVRVDGVVVGGGTTLGFGLDVALDVLLVLLGGEVRSGQTR